MRRVLLFFLAIIAAVSFSGCRKSDYEHAMRLYRGKNYEEAYNILSNLGNYKDSAQKCNECLDEILEARYNKALSLISAGKSKEAAELLDKISDYKDAAVYLKAYNYLQQFFGTYNQDFTETHLSDRSEYYVSKGIRIEVKDGASFVLTCKDDIPHLDIAINDSLSVSVSQKAEIGEEYEVSFPIECNYQICRKLPYSDQGTTMNVNKTMTARFSFEFSKDTIGDFSFHFADDNGINWKVGKNGKSYAFYKSYEDYETDKAQKFQLEHK